MAERRPVRLEDVRLRSRRSRYTASDMFRFQQNEHQRLGVGERRQRKTADQNETRLRSLQLRDYNRLAFQCYKANDYSLSHHVLINPMTEVWSLQGTEI